MQAPAAGPNVPPPPPPTDAEENAIKMRSLKISVEDSRDMKWQTVPIQRRTGKSQMPLILRNLAPSSGFNPERVWEEEKRRMEEAEVDSRAADRAAAAAAASKKKPKEKKLSKKEQIQEQVKQRMHDDQLQNDLERLKNATSKGNSVARSAALMSLQHSMTTDLGRLNMLLEVLALAVDSKDVTTVFDALWTVEGYQLYVKAVQEEAGAEEDGEDKKKSKKKDKDKDKKPAVRRSKECQLVYDFRKVLRKARKMRDEVDLVQFQLCQMPDKLPPLSRFTRGYSLDVWQKRVLTLVDEQKSVIVCAPTSSGKTIVSTYVCVTARRVLFVVPTEPLVWQVAALFQQLLKGHVALVTESMMYRPEMDASRVVVGTPLALESALTKCRGPVHIELQGKLDYTLVEGGFDFDYCVFDEVHSLDSAEGGALQRLIKALKCPFIALSATIGNGEELKSWWQTVKTMQMEDLEVVEEEEKAHFSVEIQQHEGRFINLQRYVWKDQEGSAPAGLQVLHPCAALTLEFLQSHGVKGASLAFTPRDAWALYEGMAKAYPEDKISDLDPHGFFAKYGTTRITLQQSKDYEEVLKQRLADLSSELPEETEALLQTFRPSDVAADIDIYAFAQELKAKEVMPGLVFQLDPFACLELFLVLLRRLEEAQLEKYPNYLEELRQKAEELERIKAAKQKLLQNMKEAEEEARDGDQTDSFVDLQAPHPEFVLSPPTSRVSAREFDDIQRELREDRMQPGHPFLRALRRGIGLYIDEAAFFAYRRVVQRLAQQGKLAIVFSDHSLAYGVNMPFRSAVFWTAMPGLIDQLMAQQMSGRAGRRGLDTQGNLVYMNMTLPEVQDLMLGQIPAIRGKEPLYPTLSLHRALSDATSGFHLKDYMVRWMGGTTLQQYLDKEEPERNFYETSKLCLQELELLRPDGALGIPRTLACAVWELRHRLPESLALTGRGIIQGLMAQFVDNRPAEYATNVGVQIEFFGIFLPIVDRWPCPEGVVPFQELQYFKKDANRRQMAADWQSLVVQSQERLSQLEGLLPPHQLESMKLPVGLEDPLDSSLFTIIKENSFAVLEPLESLRRLQLKNRLWAVGQILLILHNTLSVDSPYELLENLTRKCFMRVRYIINDLVAAGDLVNGAAEQLEELTANGDEDTNTASAENGVPEQKSNK
mmetsp:Transcript_4019/g.5978  ORF Transcript_4019/g.5978 Transcript_4019/m.5978 type:complete len:1164 (-) Transcript_4019:285-3776(-)